MKARPTIATKGMNAFEMMDFNMGTSTNTHGPEAA
jgi:hypothetical protein